MKTCKVYRGLERRRRERPIAPALTVPHEGYPGISQRAKLRAIDAGLYLLDRARGWLGVKRDAIEIRKIDRLALNRSPDPACFLNEGLSFWWMNAALLEKLGYKAAELKGRSFISLVHPEDADLARERLASLMGTGEPSPCGLRIRTKGGGYIWGWVIGRVLVERGKRTGLVVSIRDILQRQSDELSKILDQELKSLHEVWGGINHELNNALLPVLGPIEMFGEKALDAKRRAEVAVQYLEKMAGRADRVRRLTRRLQLLSEFSTRAKTYNDLALLIDTVLNHFEDRFFSSNITVIRGGKLASENREKIMASLQFAGVQLLLMELLSNAVDAINGEEAHSKGAAREIRVSLKVEEGKRRSVVLEVSDSGCGISAEDKEMIFEPFYTTKPAGRGTGLGMMLVQRVVQEHEGKIEVKSAPGKGTKVIVRIPLS